MNPNLPAAIRMGPVALNSANLERAAVFYQRTLGLEILKRHPDRLALGSDAPILVLFDTPGAKTAPSGTTGLYHIAVRYPSRLEFARAYRRAGETGAPVERSNSHGTSESFYLSDPDGTGIELCYDRPEAEWPRKPDGSINIYSGEVDMPGVQSELAAHPEPAPQAAAGVAIGHVHLHVADLTAAEDFYTQAIGFRLAQRYDPECNLFAAGAYHHHLGNNTWGTRGAPPPPPGSTGLRWFAVQLPDRPSLDEALERVRTAGFTPTEQPEGWLVRDPSGNAVLLRETLPG